MHTFFRKRTFTFILPIVLFIFLVIIISIHHNKGTFDLIKIESTQNESDIKTTKIILNEDITFKDRYDSVFYYFLSSFMKYSTQDYALVNYPGMLSTAGNRINKIEGVARTLPLLSAWIYSGRPPVINIDGNNINLIELVRTSILSGTNPKSKNYWGDVTDRDQRILEASDIAKSLWLTKHFIWDNLDEKEKKQIASWLLLSAKAKTIKNNWLLSPYIINLFLSNVGFQTKDKNENYLIFKKNYLENGWFRDGADGQIDYYNTWGISYDLFWILMMGGDDSEFIKKTLMKSSEFTSHLISKNGIPFMGRSMCYRTAIPTPIIINGYLSGNVDSQGVAKSSLDYTWKYFASHQALVSDTLSMGYFNNDERFVNNYSGSGSCLWGLRSLVVAFMNEPKSTFWVGEFKELPIDISDFKIQAPTIGWIITGEKKTGEIKINIKANKGNSPKIKDGNKLYNLLSRFLGRAGRPEQFDMEYLNYEYSSSDPISKKMTH